MSIMKRMANKLKKMLGINSPSVRFRVTYEEEGDRLYSLCQRYMSVWDNNDGYWLTVTELDMYEEIKRKHTELGILKKEEE